MNEVLKTLEALRKKEMNIVDGLEATINDIADPFMKTMMTSLVTDSKKHAEILQSLIDYKTGKISESLQHVNISARVKLSNARLKHQNIEGEVAEEYSALASNIEDPVISSFLELLANDERQHHRLLTYLFRWHTDK